MTQAIVNTTNFVQAIASLASIQAIAKGVKNIETWMKRLKRRISEVRKPSMKI